MISIAYAIFKELKNSVIGLLYPQGDEWKKKGLDEKSHNSINVKLSTKRVTAKLLNALWFYFPQQILGFFLNIIFLRDSHTKKLKSVS